MKLIQNMFLDAGGVILNEESHEKIRAEIISGLLRSTLDTYSQEDYWNDIEEAVFRFVPSVYDYVIWKNVKDENTYKRVKFEYRKIWKGINPELILMDGMREVIPVLSKKYRIGILGQYGIELRELIKKSNLMDYFSYDNTQEQFNITKPDPRYFEQVLDKASAMADESIMVGDRIDKDIIPAKQIGMKTIRIKVGLHRNQAARVFEEIPDYEYDSIFGLLHLC